MNKKIGSLRKNKVKRITLDAMRANIEEGLRQAAAGEFAKESEVSTAFARWRK